MGKLYPGAVGITAYVAPCSRPAGGSTRTGRNEDDGVLSGPLDSSERDGRELLSRMGASVKRPRQFLSISTLISFILISLVRPIVDRLVRSVFIVALAVAQRRTAGQQQGIEDQEAEQNTRPRKTTQEPSPHWC